MPTRIYRHGQSSRLTPGQWMAYTASGLFVLLLIIGAVVGRQEAITKNRARAERAAQVQREWEETIRQNEQIQQQLLERWQRPWRESEQLRKQQEFEQARKEENRRQMEIAKRSVDQKLSLGQIMDIRGAVGVVGVWLPPVSWQFEMPVATLNAEKRRHERRLIEEWLIRWEQVRRQYRLTKWEMEVIVPSEAWRSNLRDDPDWYLKRLPGP